jgi:hypothetical protein
LLKADTAFALVFTLFDINLCPVLTSRKWKKVAAQTAFTIERFLGTFYKQLHITCNYIMLINKQQNFLY